jgi:hypothetical protein
MAMTLRLDATDEAVLRDVAERTNHTLTDAVALSIRHNHESLLRLEEENALAARASRRAAHRKAIDESMERNAEALDLLSQ